MRAARPSSHPSPSNMAFTLLNYSERTIALKLLCSFDDEYIENKFRLVSLCFPPFYCILPKMRSYFHPSLAGFYFFRDSSFGRQPRLLNRSSFSEQSAMTTRENQLRFRRGHYIVLGVRQAIYERKICENGNSKRTLAGDKKLSRIVYRPRGSELFSFFYGPKPEQTNISVWLRGFCVPVEFW